MALGWRIPLLVVSMLVACRAAAPDARIDPAPLTPPSTEGEAAKPVAQKAAPLTPRQVSAGVNQIGPYEFDVSRRWLDEVLEDPRDMMGSSRILSIGGDGGVTKLRVVFGPTGRSLIRDVGLQTNDTIASVNGYDVATPENALQAYAAVRAATTLRVLVERDGVERTLVYHMNP